MAVRNSTEIYIGGINRTHYAVMPFKWGNFLDEQLDEACISLRHIGENNFPPLTPVEVVLKNEVYFGSSTLSEQTETKQFVVANDDAQESPIGSGLYDHELYIIELTKILETIMVDTCTFTNDLGRTYAGAAETVEYTSISSGMPTITNYPSFSSPQQSGTSYTFPSADYVWYGMANGSGRGTYYTYNGWVTVSDGTNTYTAYDDDELTITLLTGRTYTITYTCEYGGSSGSTSEYSLVYVIVCVSNVLPLKRWTITDVIKRLCAIAEPIRYGESPRFWLAGIDPVTGDIEDGSQAALFDKIYAPQFSFTQQTFRECLQGVGGVVHGEPRLTAKQDSEENWYYEISFDMYGGTDTGTIAYRSYIKNSVSQAIESYASSIDTSAENLVNSLDSLSGVIVEPYAGGYKSVRTESMYTRITDENMLIATQFPIYSIEKLECGYVTEGSTTYDEIGDITDYVFESALYGAQLSSYNSSYPYSKAYGIMYTQGEENITQLNFKQENPISTAFSRYAILNILREVSGEDIGDLEDDYPLLAFRVTYIPYYSARIGQTKTNYEDFPVAAAINYNQTANVIETRYFGENLKGVIARLGNIEMEKVYKLSSLSMIPQAGQKYDDDYYISVVETEMLPTCIKCSVGLSKDFNRLSEYIGISSTKRYSEVSQTEASERRTLWKEYIVVGSAETADDDCYIGTNFMIGLRYTFLQTTSYGPITRVVAWGGTYDSPDSGLPEVSLPVISSAFGNSISFSWEYADNYSAGPRSTYVSATYDGSTVTGYFQDDSEYTDYYGRIYYYNFDLQRYGAIVSSADEQNELALALPEGVDAPTSSGAYVSTLEADPITLRKDNREKLQCNFQIDFVSNMDGLIIGSALASYNQAVRGGDTSLKAIAYVFDDELSKFVDHVEGAINVDLSDLTPAPVSASSVSNGRFYVYFTPPTTGKSWAIVTAQATTSETVEDEEGNETTQKTYSGGDVLLAKNGDIDPSQYVIIYLTMKRDVFDKTVWIEKK